MGAEVVHYEEFAFNVEHGDGEIIFFNLEALVLGDFGFFAQSDITASI